MTTFILSKSSQDKRIVLDHVDHGHFIASINGDEEKRGKSVIKSAWMNAREKVDESKLIHVEGRGWFASVDDAFPPKVIA